MEWKALQEKIYKRLSGSCVGRNAPETGILPSFLQTVFMERSLRVQNRWSGAWKQSTFFHVFQRTYRLREDTHPWDVISHALVQSSASGSGQGPQSCLRCIRQSLCSSLQEGCPLGCGHAAPPGAADAVSTCTYFTCKPTYHFDILSCTWLFLPHPCTQSCTLQKSEHFWIVKGCRFSKQ